MDLCLPKTQTGKSYVLQKLRFQNVFSSHENETAAFPNDVIVFRDGCNVDVRLNQTSFPGSLIYPPLSPQGAGGRETLGTRLGLTVEIKLRFQFFPANCTGVIWNICNAFIFFRMKLSDETLIDEVRCKFISLSLKRREQSCKSKRNKLI